MIQPGFFFLVAFARTVDCDRERIVFTKEGLEQKKMPTTSGLVNDKYTKVPTSR